MRHPGFVISALRGGSGKTILSIGISAALKRAGLGVAPFKKGPDYIDAGWLAQAAGRPCYNLDTFLIEPEEILRSFHSHAYPGDIAVIEGNRGLYDCINTDGKTSTAELARLLDLPVILCLDATKTTRTMAAVVSGCAAFDPRVRIGGVILNRVAGTRHETILRQSIEEHCRIPVLGAVPRLGRQAFPERHMGLVPTHEHQWARDAIQEAARVAEDHLDLDAILALAGNGPIKASRGFGDQAPGRSSSGAGAEKPKDKKTTVSASVKIGVIRDSAFQFYYPENLEALVAAGAEIEFISPFSNKTLPHVDGLYIGGGFPETHAKELAEKVSFRDSIRATVEKGLPVYAECGGLMYLGEALVLKSCRYPMAGVLPITFGFSKKPQGHGYTIIRVDRDNPYFATGTEFRGHEFHYSTVIDFRGEDRDMVFCMDRGNGIVNNRDGLCYKNVLATYTHLHALGTPQWATAMVQNAFNYRKTVV
jgi:cobyrinic acid a,c-diamide synthase